MSNSMYSRILASFRLLPTLRGARKTRADRHFLPKGNLFSSDVKRVHTPLPPSMENLPSGPAIDPVIAAFSAAESRRGGDNLLDCNGYIDFRDIADVANLESGKGKKSQCRFGITLRTGEKLVMQVGGRCGFSTRLESNRRNPRHIPSNQRRSGCVASRSTESIGEQSSVWSESRRDERMQRSLTN